MRKIINNLDVNRVYTIAIFVVNTISLLVAMRLMSAYSSDGVFTSYMLFANVFGVLLALDLGIQQTLAKEVREYCVTGVGVHPYVSMKSYGTIGWCVGLGFGICTLIISLVWDELEPTQILIAFFVAVQNVATYLALMYTSVLKATDKFRDVFLVQSLVGIITLLFSSLLVLGFSFNLGVPLSLAGGQLIALYFLQRETGRVLKKQFRSECEVFRWVDARDALIRARHYIVNSLSVVLNNQGQRLLMAKLLGVVESAALTSMMNIVGKVHQICAIYSEVLFYKAIGMQRRDIFYFYARETITVFLLALFPLSFFIIYGDAIYIYLMGNKVGGVAVDLNPYVCVIVLIMCLSAPASYLLNSIGEVRVNTWYSFANSLGFLVLLPLFFDEVTKSVVWYVAIMTVVYVINFFVYHLVVVKILMVAK